MSSDTVCAAQRRRPTRREVLGGTLGLATLLRAPRALASSKASRDAAGRVLVDTFLDGRGPFRFLLDTGAATSTVSAFLARELHLPAVDDAGAAAGVQVEGSTGASRFARVRARRLAVDQLQLSDPLLGVLPEGASGPRGSDIDGVLGAELLQSARLAWARADSRLTIEASQPEQRRRGSDRIVAADAATASPRAVPIGGRLGPLLAVSGSFRRYAGREGTAMARPSRASTIEVRAIIDTGAQRTVGNEALARALRLAREAVPQQAIVQGAGGQALAALQYDSPPLNLGGCELPALPLLYADLPLFSTWGWSGRPAILLGMDLLGRLSRLSIDYPRSRVAVAIDEG